MLAQCTRIDGLFFFFLQTEQNKKQNKAVHILDDIDDDWCLVFTACNRKEIEPHCNPPTKQTKKPRFVFNEVQRRTLHAVFKETKRPSKEMQASIAQQLGLSVTTVANFFMNARRRSLDKWEDGMGNNYRSSASSSNLHAATASAPPPPHAQLHSHGSPCTAAVVDAGGIERDRSPEGGDLLHHSTSA